MIQLVALGQFPLFGGDALGNLEQLVTVRQFVFDTHKQLFEFGRQVDDRRQNHHKSAVLLAGQDLPGQSLDNFGRLQEPMEVLQHQDGRAIGRGRIGQHADRRQRISRRGIAAFRLATVLQTAIDIPRQQAPVFISAQLGDFDQSIAMLVALDPDAGETGADVLRQTLGERHKRSPKGESVKVRER